MTASNGSRSRAGFGRLSNQPVELSEALSHAHAFDRSLDGTRFSTRSPPTVPGQSPSVVDLVVSKSSVGVQFIDSSYSRLLSLLLVLDEALVDEGKIKNENRFTTFLFPLVCFPIQEEGLEPLTCWWVATTCSAASLLPLSNRTVVSSSEGRITHQTVSLITHGYGYC